jgi:hypothetical protein
VAAGYLDLPSVTPETSIAYGILDGGNSWEYGSGLCNGTTMTRAPSTSSNANSAINLSGGSALVFSGVVGSQIPNLTGANSFSGGSNAFSGGVGVTGGLSTDNLLVSGTLTLSGGTAIPGIYVGATGSATPSISAPQGSLFLNTTASTTTSRLFVNTTGGTAWARFTTNV